MTSIEGEFDFMLEIAPDEVTGPAGVFLSPRGTTDDAAGSVFTSLRKYALKLESRNLPIQVVVVDHAEKDPTEN